MLVTTTPNIEGHHITRYLGIVSGETILGANIFRNATIVAYESSLIEAKNGALREMMQQAAGLGANAIVGVDLDFEGVGHSSMMVSASGTAVVIE